MARDEILAARMGRALERIARLGGIDELEALPHHAKVQLVDALQAIAYEALADVATMERLRDMGGER